MQVYSAHCLSRRQLGWEGQPAWVAEQSLEFQGACTGAVCSLIHSRRPLRISISDCQLEILLLHTSYPVDTVQARQTEREALQVSLTVFEILVDVPQQRMCFADQGPFCIRPLAF